MKEQEKENQNVREKQSEKVNQNANQSQSAKDNKNAKDNKSANENKSANQSQSTKDNKNANDNNNAKEKYSEIQKDKINYKVLRILKYYARHIYEQVRSLAKWLLFALIAGVGVGGISSAFAIAMNVATEYRSGHIWVFIFLPIGGLIIVAMYSAFHYKNDKGTNLVLSMIHSKADIPFKMAPLIFMATTITHFVGGSAGREGAALQLGGSIGNQLGRWFHLDEQDKHVLVMCGMSAAFAALFGTPMAAAIFAMEVVSVGVMYYAALLPCVFSSIIASRLSISMGIDPEAFHIIDIPTLNILTGSKMILIAAICGVLSILFCMLLHGTGDLFRKYLKNPYIRIVTASFIIMALTFILWTDDYMGAGINVIERAIEGEANASGFFWKMIFTALTIEAGFKGGEIVPSFFIGATFGCAFGHFIGLSPSLCGATGMIAMFCGVTNCPITSMMIAFELFGFEAVPYFLIAISISFVTSGYYGLYHDQTIVYSKYKAKFINRNTVM